MNSLFWTHYSRQLAPQYSVVTEFLTFPIVCKTEKLVTVNIYLEIRDTTELEAILLVMDILVNIFLDTGNTGI